MHALHVWTLTTGRNVSTAHVVRIEKARDDLLATIYEEFKRDFGTLHTENCGDMHEPLHADSQHASPERTW